MTLCSLEIWHILLLLQSVFRALTSKFWVKVLHSRLLVLNVWVILRVERLIIRFPGFELEVRGLFTTFDLF